MGLFTAKRAEM